ncbi:hypothetical protein SJAG_06585, partial [Schizosaccharomyces japonicus yFS275]
RASEPYTPTWHGTWRSQFSRRRHHWQWESRQKSCETNLVHGKHSTGAFSRQDGREQFGTVKYGCCYLQPRRGSESGIHLTTSFLRPPSISLKREDDACSYQSTRSFGRDKEPCGRCERKPGHQRDTVIRSRHPACRAHGVLKTKNKKQTEPPSKDCPNLPAPLIAGISSDMMSPIDR